MAGQTRGMFLIVSPGLIAASNAWYHGNRTEGDTDKIRQARHITARPAA